MSEEYKIFVKQCIKNRKFLDYSYKDMAACLIDISESEYASFEQGSYIMDKNNLKRLSRVLCIKKPITINLNDYIDTSELDDDEINDIAKAFSTIVGDENA